MTENRLLQSALIYAGWGWPVFPLRAGDKRPALKDWPNLATTDAEAIRAWWARWPGANIGLACGDLMAVDLDVKGGADGPATWAALGIDGQTVTSRTPSGGRHLIYSANSTAIRNSAGKLGPGVDVRGMGGYIVLPPSTLGDGQDYAWKTRPTDRGPAPLPGVLAALLAEPEAGPGPGSPSRPAAVNAGPYARAAFDRELDELARAAEGERNDRLNQAAFSLGQLVGAGLLGRAEVETALEAVARAIGLGGRETLASVKSGLDAGGKEPRQVPERGPVATEPPPIADPSPAVTSEPAAQAEDLPLDGYRTTDLGNAERLAAWHGDDLRFCDPWGGWLAWDGKRWRSDDTREIERRANDTARAMEKAAYNEPGPERRAALGKWAFKCESDHRRRAMINGARALLPILPEDLDADPWLLTVENGTIDLRTGKLQPHRRKDFITKLAPVDYDPDAEAPTWAAFLDRIMAGSQDLIGFLRRTVGYSLTGDTREQCLFILYGTGANGKSTFLEALSDLLSDYARKTPTKTVLVRPSEGVSEDIARLKGARLVTAVEAEEGQRLAESLVKEMTGGDTMAARHLYGRTFEFRPEFKLFLATNHKPAIRGTDRAIWRRIRLIPFEVTIPEAEQDKILGEKLQAELPGILAWAVRGCLEWQREGLGTPKEVIAATGEYQVEMDILAGFLEDCCLIKTTAKAAAKDLYGAYAGWCEDNGERAIAKRTFGLRLRERGFGQGRTGQARFWRGIGLLSEPEQLDLMEPGQ